MTQNETSGDTRAAAPEGIRIAKAMARAGLCSRREAEAWIEAGRVAVNGTTITTPAVNVMPRDRVTVDGAPLPERERTRLFLYYKPVGLVTTNADPEGRPTIFDALPQHLPRLITVGRLDIATEGLLLLTNDGGLARVLELPASGWLRRYRVRAYGHVEQAALEKLRDGLTVDGIHYGPIEAVLEREQASNVWLGIGIREGKNREVRNVVEALGLQVNRLIRVSFGPFQLGEMAEGEVTEVRTRVLREQLGERIADEAECDFSSPVAVREDAEARAAARPERSGRPERRDDSGRRMERRDQGRPPRDDRRRDDRGSAPRWRDGDEQRGRGARGRGDDERRGRGRRERDGADKPLGRPRRGHTWRSDDAPLGRHYRGAGTKTRQSLPDDSERPKRAGLIADRKGRRVLVERFGEAPKTRDAPLPNPPPQGGRERGRAGLKSEASSEARGGRPERRSNSWSDTRGDRPGRREEGSERPPRKTFGDRPRSKPAWREENSERPPRKTFGDRPRSKPGWREENSERPPRKTFGDRPRSKPAWREEGSERPPRKTFGDRPRSKPAWHEEGSERPPRKTFDDRPRSKPAGREEGSERPARKTFDDRPRSKPAWREEGSERAPRKTFGDRPRSKPAWREEGSERAPRKTFGDRPRTKSAGREEGSERARRFSNTSPLEGKAGAQRREGGEFQPRGSKRAHSPGAKRDGKPYASRGPQRSGPKPPRDRPRGAGPRPTRPGGPKKRK